jgi:hypothetical protein
MKISSNKIKLNNITKFDLYNELWQGVNELFMALEYRYLPKLKINDKKDYEKFVSILESYNSLEEENKRLDINDLKFCIDNIRKVLYLSGFDNVSVRVDDEYQDFENEE